jgi:hypothetical protein
MDLVISSADIFSLTCIIDVMSFEFLRKNPILSLILRIQERARKAQPGKTEPAPGFPDVEPLETFDWKTTEPLQIRPFKPKYHLTMGGHTNPSPHGQDLVLLTEPGDGNTALENLEPSELLLIDKNYKDRIELRRDLIKEHNDIVVGVNDEEKIRPAVYELYTYLFGTYLPGRYPTMFKLERADYEMGKITFLHNSLTNELFPVRPMPSKPTSFWLELLGKTIDEDFLLLLPSENYEKDNSYVLEGYICCFPSGFNPKQKLGKRLREIHEPVPSYKEKIEGSMDRYFNKLEVGKYVKRFNWSVTVDSDLYAADGHTHAYKGAELKQEDVDIDKVSTRILTFIPRLDRMLGMEKGADEHSRHS